MELLFRLGSKWRNPSLFPRFEFLKASERWSRDQLIDFQTSQCRALLEFAKRHSSYYREVFRAAGFGPSDLKSLEDLERLPVTEKGSLIRDNSAIHTDYPFKRVFRCETSGTSGQVLTFRRDEVWDSGNRAAVMRGDSWFGAEPWDKSVYLWGFNADPIEWVRVRILGALQNQFPVFSCGEKEIRRLASHTRTAAVLHGYSSMVYNNAKALKEDGRLPGPGRLMLVTTRAGRARARRTLSSRPRYASRDRRAYEPEGREGRPMPRARGRGPTSQPVRLPRRRRILLEYRQHGRRRGALCAVRARVVHPAATPSRSAGDDLHRHRSRRDRRESILMRLHRLLEISAAGAPEAPLQIERDRHADPSPPLRHGVH